MTWDLMLVTVTLVTALVLIILLVVVSRIWQDRTPHSHAGDPKHRHAPQSRSVKVERVGEQENSLA